LLTAYLPIECNNVRSCPKAIKIKFLYNCVGTECVVGTSLIGITKQKFYFLLFLLLLIYFLDNQNLFVLVISETILFLRLHCFNFLICKLIWVIHNLQIVEIFQQIYVLNPHSGLFSLKQLNYIWNWGEIMNIWEKLTFLLVLYHWYWHTL